MKIKIWPWTKFEAMQGKIESLRKALDCSNNSLEQSRKFHLEAVNKHLEAVNALVAERKEHDKGKSDLRQMATIMALRAGIFSMFMLCFTCSSQPILRQLFTTNPPPVLSSITAPMVGTNGSGKPELTYNAGALTNINDTLLQSSGWVPVPWGGPSNAFPTVYSPISNAYFFYTTTTPVSITNMPCIAGTNTWATLVISNQTANLITQYCTVPGARIYGNPWAGGASNAVIIQPGKTCITSGWGTSTLMTNFAIQQQDN